MQYVIKQVKSFYGPVYKASLVGSDSPHGCHVWPNRKEAMAWINRAESSPYYQAYGEYGRPIYTVLSAERVPKYLRDQCHLRQP